MSYLNHIETCNQYNENNKIALMVNGQRVGQIFKEHLDYCLNYEMFTFKDGFLKLDEKLDSFEKRTEAFKFFAKQAVKDGLIGWVMNENYPLIEKIGAEPLAFIDRSISTFFGTISFGQHLNGYVKSKEGVKMWISRRASNKGYEAGKLDHLVAGGLPYDIGLEENLQKECYEEAGMSKTLSNQAKLVGLVSYRYDYRLGGKEDILYCYDIELSEEFVPVCTDGEVEEFYLMPIEEVAEIVKNSQEFKLNCNLVIIDFLVRHGFLSPNDEDYVEIVKRLRS